MPLIIPNAGSVQFASIGGQNIMSVPRDQAVALLRKYAVTYGMFEDNSLGLYTLASVGNQDTISFMNFTPPKHVFQPRLNACTWRPKGKVGQESTRLTLQSIEYNGEQCPDGLYGSCWERIFGAGTAIHDFTATEEGRTIVNELLRQINIGLGNSLHEALEWGQNTLIDDADENGWFPVDAEEWDAFKDQQTAVTGRMTLIDGLKAEGLDHYNVDIDSYLNAAGAWTGDIFDFLDSLIAARPVEFRVAENQPGAAIKGIIECDEATFNEFANQLVAQFTTIPTTYELFVMGESGPYKLPNALKYKGYALVPQTSWSMFDAITGTITRRALLSFPGVHGIAYDVAGLSQYSGVGMIVQQLDDIRLKGRMDMYTILKVGSVILDTKFCVNASITITQ